MKTKRINLFIPEMPFLKKVINIQYFWLLSRFPLCFPFFFALFLSLLFTSAFQRGGEGFFGVVVGYFYCFSR